MTYINRRRFLKSSSALGFTAGTGLLAAIGASSANAANTSGYKALICLFFKGGMDQSDFILPVDKPSHDALGALRPDLFDSYNVGSGSSSRDRENLLKLNASNINGFGGREFGLAPEMSELHSLFESGNAAIIGNVGPLIEPTTRTTMAGLSARIPERLFSHNDQQSMWTSFGVEGSKIGWGGRFSDAAINSDATTNRIFTAISTSGNDVFLSGEMAKQFAAPVGIPEAARILRQRTRFGSGRNSDAARAAIEDHLAAANITSTNLYAKDLIDINRRTLENATSFRSAIETGTSVSEEFPESQLGRQLQTVANTIAARGIFNVSRQVFYVAIPGFDTHNGQTRNMPILQADISSSVAAFQRAMNELGVEQDVTLFTASDFGRTVISNKAGTDHGWGGHHFVVGGAVQGKRIYGTIPEYDVGAETYTESRGRLIPSVSVDQYAASLGTWFGLSENELNDALPNLNNFSVKDLGLFQGSNT